MPSSETLRDLSLGDLVTRLPLSQLWGLAGVIIVILCAAFTLGTQVSGKDALVEDNKMIKSQIVSKNAEIDDYKKHVANLDYQNSFFSTYLRYISWSTPALVDLSKTQAERELKLQSARREFVEITKQMWQEKHSNIPSPHKIDFSFDKGADGEIGIITFDGGASWRIPPEIKREVHGN